MIVADAGPLIALAKVDALALIQSLFEFVSVPQSVWDEVMAKSGVEVERLTAASDDFLRVEPNVVLAEPLAKTVRGLGAGEQQAIALALTQASVLLADDWKARRVAQALGVSVTGTAGVLLLAKEKGLLDKVRPHLEAMRRAGYWLSDDFVEMAARLAGES